MTTERTQAPSLDDQRGFYSDLWGKFERPNSFDLARISKVLSIMAEIELPKAPRICDFGCGAGWGTGILGAFGQATGVDLSDTSAARSRYPHCRFFSADVLAWDASPAAFDLVVSMEVIEHFEEASQARYLSAASRLLAPRGYLILTTPNARTMNAIPGGGRSWSNQPIENWLDATPLKHLLRQNGFEIRASTSFILGVGSLGSYRLVNSFKINRALRALRLHGLWRRAAGWSNYGLHLAVLAQKR